MLPAATSSTMNGHATRQPLVLVVEDEPQMRRFLVSALLAHGFRSLHVGTSVGSRAGLGVQDHDLLIVDVGHAGVDAFALTSRLRGSTSAPIVAVLNPAREEERSRVLDAGADDYLVKPFGTGELLGRVRVWLKQSARTRDQGRADAPPAHLRIDRNRHCLVVDGREVHITPLEYRLLEALARTSTAMTEAQILRAVWGRGNLPPVQYLRANVRQLRQKIEKDPARPRHLLGEPGGGYRVRLG